MPGKKFICEKCQYEIVYHTDVKNIKFPTECPRCNSRFKKEKENDKMEYE